MFLKNRHDLQMGPTFYESFTLFIHEDDDYFAGFFSADSPWDTASLVGLFGKWGQAQLSGNLSRTRQQRI